MAKNLCRISIILVLLLLILYPKSHQIGDINKDGFVDLKDMLILHKYLRNDVDILSGDLHLLDINGDGIVDEEDLEAMRNHFLSIEF